MRTIIRAVSQSKKFLPDCGDFVAYDDRDNILQPFKKEELEKDFTYFPLTECYCQKLGRQLVPEKQLELMGIKADILQKYECVYTKLEYYSLIPVALLFKTDLETYGLNEENQGEMYFDRSWMWRYCTDADKLNSVQSSLLGGGFPKYGGISMNDGSGDLQHVVIDLDNGDKLLCVTHMWYNK